MQPKIRTKYRLGIHFCERLKISLELEKAE